MKFLSANVFFQDIHVVHGADDSQGFINYTLPGRPREVLRNGVQIAAIKFPSSGAWTEPGKEMSRSTAACRMGVSEP